MQSVDMHNVSSHPCVHTCLVHRMAIDVMEFEKKKISFINEYSLRILKHHKWQYNKEDLFATLLHPYETDFEEGQMKKAMQI